MRRTSDVFAVMALALLAVRPQAAAGAEGVHFEEFQRASRCPWRGGTPIVAAGGKARGVVAGKDTPFTLQNLILFDPTNGSRHISGIQVSMKRIIAMCEARGVTVERVTPTDAVFREAAMARPVQIPEWTGVKGVGFNPFLSRELIGRRLGFLGSLDLRRTAVHIVEPLISQWFPRWLHNHNLRHSMAYHGRYNAFARKSKHDLVASAIRRIDGMGSPLGRLGLRGKVTMAFRPSAPVTVDDEQPFFDDLYYAFVRRTFRTATRVFTR